MKEKNQNRKNIGVGSVVKENVGDMEDNKRKGRIRRKSREVVGCVNDVFWKNIFLVQLKDEQNK